MATPFNFLYHLNYVKLSLYKSCINWPLYCIYKIKRITARVLESLNIQNISQQLAKRDHSWEFALWFFVQIARFLIAKERFTFKKESIAFFTVLKKNGKSESLPSLFLEERQERQERKSERANSQPCKGYSSCKQNKLNN